jgi:hypothetical protein
MSTSARAFDGFGELADVGNVNVEAPTTDIEL